MERRRKQERKSSTQRTTSVPLSSLGSVIIVAIGAELSFLFSKMAAKQGLSAQISQASEDAKRAVLNRTSLTNSLWFSNLNTTCTIKSAPPRTPDVLGLLSTKSGWLFKRNEQHVWQPRYCCVVPHTFLYYFDAHPSQPCQAPHLSTKEQDELNQAVRQGYGKRGALKPHQPRSSLYHVLGGNHQQPQQNSPPVESEVVTDQSQSTLQPAGIIDLECYTTIHRNSQNELLMELAGDESVNPDLRSFYFCANNEDEGEEWNQALLQNRHSALFDEKEAYRQVCDGFAQQLQVLHSDLESAQSQAETRQEELYRVRSQMEDTRRSCLRLVGDTLERADGTVPSAKRAYRTDLETIQAQDLGILAAVQLLCDYTRVLEEMCRDSGSTIEQLETQLQSKQEGDSTRVQQLEAELKQAKEEMKQQQTNWQAQVETVTQKYIHTQKELQDVQKDLASQRMETTMYQSSTRTKLGELQSHKKILKKEVIDLRKKLEEANSQLDLFKHKESSVKMEVEQERQKAKLLERYVEKMESQVKVQQNMMEMMSANGSQYGGGSMYGDNPDYHQQMDVTIPTSPAPPRSVNRAYTPSGRREYGNIIVNTPSSVQPDEDDVDHIIHADDHDDEADDVGVGHHHDDGVDHDDEEDRVDRPGQERMVPIPSTHKRTNSSHRRTIDDDAKSHMSELTEDRTQKQFDAAFFIHQQQQKENSQFRAVGASPRNMQHHALMGGPPSIIIGGVSEERSDKGSASSQPVQPTANANAVAPKLDTIMSTHSATRPRSEMSRYNDLAPPKPQTPRQDGDAHSVSSMGSKPKLSVAQRARMEADRQSTPVRVRMNQQQSNGSNSSTQESNVTPLRGRNSAAAASARKESSRLTPSAQSSNQSASGGSFFSNWGRKLENALDSSILGVDNGSDYASSYVSTDVGTDGPDDDDDEDQGENQQHSSQSHRRMSLRSHEEEKKMGETASETSGVSLKKLLN